MVVVVLVVLVAVGMMTVVLRRRRMRHDNVVRLHVLSCEHPGYYTARCLERAQRPQNAGLGVTTWWEHFLMMCL